MPFLDKEKKKAWNRRNRERQRVYAKRWRQRNPEKLKSYQLAAYRRRAAKHNANGLTVNGQVYKSRRTKPEWIKADNKRRSSNARELRNTDKVFELLGGRCARVSDIGCADGDREVLEIDHINGDGFLDRRNTGRSSGSRCGRIMTQYRRHGLDYIRAKYQLLCSNCHARKTKRERNERLLLRQRIEQLPTESHQQSLFGAPQLH